MLLLGVLACYACPERWRLAARALTAGVLAIAMGLLISVLPLVFPSGRLERTLAELVPGVNLTLRAESSGVVILLLSTSIALIALLEGVRRPLERAALLLCVLGTAVAALGGNAVLLFGGLELGNVGAVLLAASGTDRITAHDRAGFVFQHMASLGLLVAALRLQDQFQTTDFVSLPPGALGTAIALIWAASGVARLVAAPGLAGEAGRATSSVWTAVVAAPTGMLVLLRLLQLTGGGLPPGVGPVVMAGGLAIALAGAVEALRNVTLPAAAGRGLCVAAAGPVVFSAGVNGGRAMGAFAAGGLALCLALAMAPAWGGGGPVGRGGRSRVVRAVALASAGGVPVGYGTVALVLTADAAATLGRLGAPAAVAFAAVALLTVGAGVAAARASLTVPDGAAGVGALRLDAAAVAGIALAAGILPGVVQSTFVRGLVGDGGIAATAVDALAVRGAGGGWPGGYLAIAVLVCLAMAGSLVVLLEATVVGADPGMPLGAAAAPSPWAPVVGWLQARTSGAAAVLRWFDRWDRWSVGQPGLAAVLVSAFVLLWVFR